MARRGRREKSVEIKVPAVTASSMRSIGEFDKYVTREMERRELRRAHARYPPHLAALIEGTRAGRTTGSVAPALAALGAARVGLRAEDGGFDATQTEAAPSRRSVFQRFAGVAVGLSSFLFLGQGGALARCNISQQCPYRNCLECCQQGCAGSGYAKVDYFRRLYRNDCIGYCGTCYQCAPCDCGSSRQCGSCG